MSKARKAKKAAKKAADPKKKTFLGKVLKIGATVATGGANKLVTKKGRQELKNVGKTIAKVGGKILESAAMPVLLPFKVAMNTILRNQGVSPEKDIPKLAQQFYNVMVLKRASYEISEPENIVPAVAAAMVSAIISYFKKLKEKKEAGEKLTTTEETALAGAEASVNEVVDQAKDEAIAETATKAFMPLIIISAIAVVIIGFFVLKGGKHAKAA